MSNPRTSLFNIILVTGVILMLFTANVFADIKDTREKSFEVSPDGELFLETDLGGIKIETHKSNRVDIKIYLEAETSSDEKAQELFNNFKTEFELRDNIVNIFGEYTKGDRGFFNFKRNRLNVYFEITVPEKFNVDLSTAGGGIAVVNLEGDINVRTSGGGLDFDNVHGDILGKTSGGGIAVNDCSGVIDVRTSGGSIRMRDTNGDIIAKTSGGSLKFEGVEGRLDAATSGGSIRADFNSDIDSDCSLTTSGGSIEVFVYPESKFNVDARTSAGSVHVDFPVTVMGKLKENALDAKINGGGPELYLRTSGGSIYIKEKMI